MHPAARFTQKLADWGRLQPFAVYQWLTVCWLLAMISIPILSWVIGDGVLPWGVLVTVILQVTAVLGSLWRAWGPNRTIRLILVIVPATWLLEWLGSTTGWPFGAYHYTAVLQPQLGQVPLIIPLAWLMMLPPAWAVATILARGRLGWSFALWSSATFTAWDLFLDPQMVRWGYWVWTYPGGYFGIPWLNFLGWGLSALLLTCLVRPRQLPVEPLLVIYMITWVLQTIGQLCFWQMPGPALTGFAAMGGLIVLALRRLASQEPGVL